MYRGVCTQFSFVNALVLYNRGVFLHLCKEITMIFLPSSKEAAGYGNRYAMAVYNLGGGVIHRVMGWFRINIMLDKFWMVGDFTCSSRIACAL